MEAKLALANTEGKVQEEFGDLILEHLEDIGVQYVFGVPGGAIEPLFNAMARSSRRGGIQPVVARHEAGAAFMADGYARETGKIGVCCSTTGPGATNLITGVASAYADQVPMLVITAQTAIPHFGKRALQESSCTAVNTVAMFQSCTCYSSLVSHRGQLESKLISAIVATQGPPAGPAHLSIPMDILGLPRRLRSGEPVPRFDSLLKKRSFTDLDALDELFEELVKAKRVVMVLGDGCREGISQILEFAEAIRAPIVTGPSGKGRIDHFHPQYFGVVGFGAHQSALEVLKDPEVDLILAVGTRLGELVFRGWDEDVKLLQKLVHIDVTTENFTRSPMARLHVCGSLNSIFQRLGERLREFGGLRPELPSVPPRLSDSTNAMPDRIVLDRPNSIHSTDLPLKPQRLMHALSRRLPENTRVLVDAGNSWAWATHYLFLRGGGHYRIGMGFGSMAWAIGAAVGTAFGCPGEPVVCLTGDGSYLMSGQEISVAVQHKLPVIFIVLNDQVLGMVKHGQRLGGGEPIGFELPQVNFAAMAGAMGAHSQVIITVEDLEALDFDEIAGRSGPTLLDVHIDTKEVPPMGARMKALGR